MSILSEYENYVNEIKLSLASTSTDVFIEDIRRNADSLDITRLICGAIGQSSECGEFLEQSLLPMSPKLVEELGDVLFYIMVCARTMNVSLENFHHDSSFDKYFDCDLPVLVNDLVINSAKFLDIVKKILFQGKAISAKTYAGLIDIVWEQYGLILIICEKLLLPIEYVIAVNRNKLDRRYKDGFTVDESENKQ